MPAQDQQAVPQFQTAEFDSQHTTGDSPQQAKIALAGDPGCCICKAPIAAGFYRINGAKTCQACSKRVISSRRRDTHAAFSRALGYGLGGALLGLILYSAVAILLHLQIGYVSLAVGYLIGKAMMLGSRNIGGRRYQWTAVVLTYAAVSLSAIPVAVAQYVQEQPAAAQVQRVDPDSPGADAQDSVPAHISPKAKPDWGKTTGMLLVLGLASPLLEFTGNAAGGLIGLIILLVGVRIAWRLTAAARLPAIEGPF